MAFLLIAPDRDTTALQARLRTLEPDLDLRVWPDLGKPADIDFALAWKPPTGAFAGLTGLRAVGSLGAGVDALVDRPDLSPEVRIVRVAGPRLAADLAAHVVAMTVDWWKRLDEQRHDVRWQPRAPRPVPRIGLLGTGVMGRAAARALRALDLPVSAWNRSGRSDLGLPIHSGPAGLLELAGDSDVLVCLLPLTQDTRGLLNASLFAAMRDDSLLINVGRGEHLVERDLLEALEHGRPGRAALDVFGEEPLPDGHPFRTDSRVVVTPHIGGLTDPAEAARIAIEQWRAIRRGEAPPNAVDRVRGY